MIKNQEKYWAPVEKGMQSFFFETYFRDIFRLLDAKEPKLNAPTSALTQAIRSGSIVYQAGTFRGDTNIPDSAGNVAPGIILDFVERKRELIIQRVFCVA